MKKVLLLLFLVACSVQPQVVNLEPLQAKDLLDSSDLFVLNVHTPYEGKIEGTDAVIEDWENIAAHIDQLPEDKNAPIFVYCRTGRMSLSAVEQLKALGYTNLYHLQGGMKAWDIAGLPLVDKSFE